MKQTFSAEAIERLVVSNIGDEVHIFGWDQPTIEVNFENDLDTLQPEGNTLFISNTGEVLEVAVPHSTAVFVHDTSDNLTIEYVLSAEVERISQDVSINTIQNDVRIRDISGDVVLRTINNSAYLGNISGDLQAFNVQHIQGSTIGGDVELTSIGSLQVDNIGGDLNIKEAESTTIHRVGGDLYAQGVTNVQCEIVSSDCQVKGNRDSIVILNTVGSDLVVNGAARLQVNTVGSDCVVRESNQAEMQIGKVGSDLVINGASSIEVGIVGSDCRLQNVQGDIRVDRVGSDLSCTDVSGTIEVGSVGSDASLKNVRGTVNVGVVGSDLYLQSSFPPDSVTRIQVGSDAIIVLPTEANLAIHARVGGDIRGKRANNVSSNGNIINWVYGQSAAQLELTVGSDLVIRGSAPSGDDTTTGWWSNFGQEMSEFGRAMGEFGRDLSAEITASVADATASLGTDIADEIRSNIGNQDYKGYKWNAKEAKKRAKQWEKNINVRVNNREWRMDSDRISRIVAQAQEAAAAGVQGALEAVEQALRNLSVSVPTSTPPPTPNPSATPANPPTPAAPTTAPEPPAQPTASSTTQQAIDERHQPEVPASAADLPDEPVQAETAPANSSATPEVADDTNTTTTPDASTPSLVAIEQEREAILKMIAEGRISPEEGDMLLEALND